LEVEKSKLYGWQREMRIPNIFKTFPSTGKTIIQLRRLEKLMARRKGHFER